MPPNKHSRDSSAPVLSVESQHDELPAGPTAAILTVFRVLRRGLTGVGRVRDEAFRVIPPLFWAGCPSLGRDAAGPLARVLRWSAWDYRYAPNEEH